MNGFPALPLVLIALDLLGRISGANILDKSPSRCEHVCNNIEKLQKDLQPDCQRGCQYFNIEFLISVTDQKQVASIGTYEAKCKSSCSDAYLQEKRRSACYQGCTKMSKIQDDAPYINNWIIFMGESDKGMVLLPSDAETLTANDWILLESFLKRDEGDYDEQLMVTDTVITEEQISPREKFFIRLAQPSWLWYIPFFMIMWILWNSFGGTTSCHSIDDHQCCNEIISNDKIMYPSLAVLPPKYSELEKDFFAESEDEEQNSSKPVHT